MTSATNGEVPGGGARRHLDDRPYPSPVTGKPGGASRHTGPMGFNPHRQYKRTTADYAMVAAAFVVCAALVAWAFLG